MSTWQQKASDIAHYEVLKTRLKFFSPAKGGILGSAKLTVVQGGQSGRIDQGI
jgi:hypothetical protein